MGRLELSPVEIRPGATGLRPMSQVRDLRLKEYWALAAFRHQLRRFLWRREQAAQLVGISAQHYQVLLSLKGREGRAPATIAAVAEQLQLRHNSAVGLIDRLVARGLIRRRRGTSDRRQVLLELTSTGEAKLRQLALYSLAELQDEGPALVRVLMALVRPRQAPRARRERPRRDGGR